MDNSGNCKKVEEDGFYYKRKLIERGRSLHNEAIQKAFISLVRELANLFRKCVGFSSRERQAGDFSGGIAAKKQV